MFHRLGGRGFNTQKQKLTRKYIHIIFGIEGPPLFTVGGQKSIGF